jgi:glucose/arabinose dehydrogenase
LPNGDGAAELRTTFIDGLNSPFGMTLVGNRLFVADTDTLRAFRRAFPTACSSGSMGRGIALHAAATR